MPSCTSTANARSGTSVGEAAGSPFGAVSGGAVPFDWLTVEQRRVHNVRVVGERCGWPELDQLVRLLCEVPGWTAHYSWHGVEPFTDHIGRAEPGIPAGCFVARPVSEESRTGSFRVIAANVAELRTALLDVDMTEPS